MLSRWLGDAIASAGAAGRPRLPGSDVVVVYTPGSEPPAHLLYIAYLHAGRRAWLAGAVEASLHILPYREDVAGVVVFTPGGRDGQAVMAAEQASMLGVETLVAGPRLHPAYEEKLSTLPAERLVVQGEHPLMAASIAALLWAPRPLGARAARLGGELEALPGAAEWVWDRFSPAIEALASEPPGVVLYTPATAAAAFYAASIQAAVAGRPPILAPLAYAHQAPTTERALALYTELERSMLRERLTTAVVRGVRIIQVNINTDPITAGVYGMLVAAAAYGEMP